MKVILDINVLLISLPKISDYRLIFDALKKGSYELGVSNEILFEYEEKLAEKTKVEIAENVIKLLLNLENAVLQNVYFTWRLITQDPDDNKYVDCAIAFNADYLVTEDRHFQVLKKVDFPKVKVINANDFLELLRKL